MSLWFGNTYYNFLIVPVLYYHEAHQFSYDLLHSSQKHPKIQYEIVILFTY